MAFYLKSTAYTRLFKLIASSDHLSKLTGGSPTVNISKAGGSFGAAGGTVTEVANGWYKVALNTTDTGTAGDLAFYITCASADDTDFVDQVVDPAVANLGVNLVNILGTVASTPATAGILDVNVKNMNNVAATAITTIKAVQGLTTADTIATYTGNTPQTGDAYARLGAPAGASVSADIAEVEAETDAIAGLVTGVNVTSINSVSTSPVTTVKAVQGLTTADTVVNLTNAPTAGDFTATMKTSIGTAVAASAVASVTGNVGGNVTGSVGSISGVTFPSNFSALSIDSNGRVKPLTGLTKNTALTGFMFQMTDATTHAPKTGLTVTSTVALSGGAFGSTVNSASEVSGGWYAINLAAGDTNGSTVALRFTSAGADDTDFSYVPSL